MAQQFMGIGRIGNKNTVLKRSYRWMVEISPFVGDNIRMLPPSKGSRPDLTFDEMKAPHLVETVSFPGRPDWGTLDITVYDITCGDNAIFNWIKRIYDPRRGVFQAARDSSFKIGEVTLKMFDGCGNVIEQWKYENVWPVKVQWGNLDMSTSEVVMVELSLKYDRAYIFTG